jgi:hypothetical protein
MKQVAVVAGLVLALASAGCGADEQADGAGGEATPTTSATPSPSQSVVLPDPEPTVEPATGPKIEVGSISVRLPDRWRPSYDTPFADTARGPEGLIGLTAIARDQMPLARAMKIDLRVTAPLEGLQEQPPTSLGRVSAYHSPGRPSSTEVRYAYGTWDAGYQVWLHFDLASRVPAKEREALVEAVVASYESS